jgi:hypothetical protein
MVKEQEIERMERTGNEIPAIALQTIESVTGGATLLITRIISGEMMKGRGNSAIRDI